MTSVNARFLRSAGIKIPRLSEDSAEEMWNQQTNRLNALLSKQAVARGPHAVFRRPSAIMQDKCIEALIMAVRYARINPEYLDYMDRQLWDIIELILECDEFSRRRVTWNVIELIQELMAHRMFPNTKFVEFLQYADAWTKMFQNINVAFEENLLSTIGIIFSQILTNQALSKELAINRALKRELARETSDEPCPVCADYIQPGEYITSLIPHCMHWLHGSCIGQWLMSGNANSGTCPMCRTVIPLDLGIPPPAPEIMDVVLFWEDHV